MAIGPKYLGKYYVNIAKMSFSILTAKLGDKLVDDFAPPHLTPQIQCLPQAGSDSAAAFNGRFTIYYCTYLFLPILYSYLPVLFFVVENMRKK